MDRYKNMCGIILASFKQALEVGFFFRFKVWKESLLDKKISERKVPLQSFTLGEPDAKKRRTEEEGAQAAARESGGGGGVTMERKENFSAMSSPAAGTNGIKKGFSPGGASSLAGGSPGAKKLVGVSILPTLNQKVILYFFAFYRDSEVLILSSLCSRSSRT